MSKKAQEFRRPTGLVLNKALARRYQNSTQIRPNQVVKSNGPQPPKAVRRPPTSNAPKHTVKDLTRDPAISASPSPDEEASDTTASVHDMPPNPAPRRYIRKGETPSQEPPSRPGAKVDPDVAHARDTLSPDSAIQSLDRLLDDDKFAEEIAHALSDSPCCVRTEFGVKYGHRGQPLHDLGPLVFRRALDKQKAQRQMRILPSAIRSQPTPPDSPGIIGSSKKPTSAMSPAVSFASHPQIIPLESSGCQTPSSSMNAIRSPTVLAENLRIFESLHPILRFAMLDEVLEAEIPIVPSVMMMRNPQALQGVMLLLILQLPGLECLRKVRPEWMKHRGGPIPEREDVEQALEFLDRIGAPRSLVQTYSTIYEIDVATWQRFV